MLPDSRTLKADCNAALQEVSKPERRKFFASCMSLLLGAWIVPYHRSNMQEATGQSRLFETELAEQDSRLGEYELQDQEIAAYIKEIEARNRWLSSNDFDAEMYRIREEFRTAMAELNEKSRIAHGGLIRAAEKCAEFNAHVAELESIIQDEAAAVSDKLALIHQIKEKLAAAIQSVSADVHQATRRVFCG